MLKILINLTKISCPLADWEFTQVKKEIFKEKYAKVYNMASIKWI
jgi:metal-sulfur cluster biosynthetic enzyme